MNRRSDLDRLYQILDGLRDRVGGYRHLADCDARSGWPKQGVYFFFEAGELREAGQAFRVVRVGTHGVSEGSRASLWSRLAWHRGKVGGAFPGGGGHRGSVFRRHVGTALLNRREYPEIVGREWGSGSSTSRELRVVEYPLERDVSAVIGSMPLLWVGVADQAGKGSLRGFIEKNAIALLSNFERPPIDPSSEQWLGLHARHEHLRKSGLWNVQHVELLTYDAGFLDLLEASATHMRPT
jgi:hypothetical protein